MANPIGVCDAAREAAPFWMMIKKFSEYIGFKEKPDKFFKDIVNDDQQLDYEEYKSLYPSSYEENKILWAWAKLQPDFNPASHYEANFIDRTMDSQDFRKFILKSICRNE